MSSAIALRKSTTCNDPKAAVRSFVLARLLHAHLFIKFCLVGGSGLVVDMGLLFLLADPRGLGLNITLSKICAAEIALINNFIWNEVWTFRGKIPCVEGEGQRGVFPGSALNPQTSTPNRRAGLFRRFLMFNAICIIGIGLAVLLLHFFHIRLGWNLYPANALAIVLAALWNFRMNTLLNWRTKT